MTSLTRLDLDFDRIFRPITPPAPAEISQRAGTSAAPPAPAGPSPSIGAGGALYEVTMNINYPSEFMARRIAREKLCERGRQAQSQASRLAAKLYRAGATVFRAARQAADQVAPSVRRDGAA